MKASIRALHASRVGFTLIELLVVIAIIGILASMLLPVLGKSKKRAMETKVINSMKQLSLAVGMYAADNDERMTYTAGSTGNNATVGLNPVDPTKCTLLPYIGGEGAADKIMICPEDKWANEPFRSGYKWSFSQNSQINDPAKAGAGRRVDAFKDPQTMALYGEEALCNNSQGNPELLGVLWPGYTNASSGPNYSINDPFWRNDTGVGGPDVLSVHHSNTPSDFYKPSAWVVFVEGHAAKISRNDGVDPRYVCFAQNAPGTPIR